MDIEIELAVNREEGPDDYIVLSLDNSQKFELSRAEAMWLSSVITHKLRTDDYTKSTASFSLAAEKELEQLRRKISNRHKNVLSQKEGK